MTTKILGERGERLAEEYLKVRGYKILERNFRIKLGEIDLIARHKDCICFIEVKTRVSCQTPQEAVSMQKQRKLIRVAQAYLKSKFDSLDVRCRFDVVAIEEREGADPRVELFMDAFQTG